MEWLHYIEGAHGSTGGGPHVTVDGSENLAGKGRLFDTRDIL